MRRTLRTAAAASLGAVLVLSAACGALADDRAAVVGDRVVTTETVDELARDVDFASVVLQGGEPTGGDDSTVSGDTARQVLLFEIQRAALLNEAERWEVEITDEHRRSAAQLLEQQVLGPDRDVNRRVRRVLVDFLAARSALDERFSEIDSASDQDLRALYDGAPALWDRVCLVVAAVPPEQVGRADRLVERGRSPEAIARRLDGVEIVADPEQSCLPVEQLPPELGRAVEDAARSGGSRRVRGPVVAADGSAYVFRVEERQRLSFDDAREELAQLAGALVDQGAGSWIGLVVQRGVDINPRYGSGIAVSPQGQVEIAPPQAPPSVPEGLPELLAP